VTDGRRGAKATTVAGEAAWAAQHPLVAEAIGEVLDRGGNAVDAAIAASLLQAVLQPELSNHAGSVAGLVWDARARQVHALNSMGTLVPDLPPFRPVPPGHGVYSEFMGLGPMAAVPGFIPGLAALHERFGSQPWAELCVPAIAAAEQGVEVTPDQAVWLGEVGSFFHYSVSGRAMFDVDGFMPRYGDVWRNPALGATLRRLASVGPTEFTEGEWARSFVARANEMGWPITLGHLVANPPRWTEPTRFSHRGHEVVQLFPPERQGVFCALVLGVLGELGVRDLGLPSRSAESMFLLGHTLRRAVADVNLVGDPHHFGDAATPLMDPRYHQLLAALIRAQRPSTDLTAHVRLMRGANALDAAGAHRAPTGSCELSIRDRDGNWVQMMHTLQSGGIPGEVVGGVPMVGSHSGSSLGVPIGAVLAPGARLRSTIGSTMVLRDGSPWLALGSPGEVWVTVPQVLSAILDHGLAPDVAGEEPFTRGLLDSYHLPVESRLAPGVVDGLAALGVLVEPLSPYEAHLGSYQMTWVGDDGTVRAATGSRRAGATGGRP
jgi:gamma-glutamyltranspeptidase/glutathione hydrolase